MKSHLAFLGVLFILFSAFFYPAFQLPKEDAPELAAFRATHQPLFEVPFGALYGPRDRFQLLHPSLALSHRWEPPPAQCQAPESGEAGASCRPNEISFILTDQPRESKDVQIDRLVQDYTPLPADFLDRPPYVNRFGQSYAYVLSQRVGLTFHSRQWVGQHLDFYRPTELREILGQYDLHNPVYELLAATDTETLAAVVRGERWVWSRDRLWWRDDSHLAFSPLTYWIYDARDLRQGDSARLQSALQEFAVAWRALLGLAFLAALFFYLRHLHDRQRAQTRQTLALQVLSHEFRTPVSSLLMTLEQLERSGAPLDEANQDRLTRLNGDARRLQRILEISRLYLQAEYRRLPFRPVSIASINEWAQDFAAEHPGLICRLLGEDRALHADPFWLRFVLTSLVQNAFSHGQPPVVLRLAGRGRQITFSIEDHGRCEFRSLREMTAAFTKSSRSQGMGLGLNITQRIVEEWGSELRFCASPTAFSLVLS